MQYVSLEASAGSALMWCEAGLDRRFGLESESVTALHSQGGVMDILVMLEDNPEHSTMLAHVNSVPAPLNSERPSRDVVTLYGVPSPESLALALQQSITWR